MGMEISKYTSPNYIGYLVRRRDGLLSVCRQLETAHKLNTTGIVRINAIDHCTLGGIDSKAVVTFTPNDQSWGTLEGAIQTVEIEIDDDGYEFSSMGKVVDYRGDF